ncbi:MAG: DUF4259 domain-containing protein, partial [Thermoanaerobaculia bacterium]|nr:DUF4259 domain-containing protein [Thermoanaerobaculia bacterium]
MGTWGVHAFENDIALDWVDESDPKLVQVEKALDKVISTPSDVYLDADDGQVGWAAAELVAVYHGRNAPGSPLKESLFTRLKRSLGLQKPNPPRPDMIAKALASLDRLVGQNSELAELWNESESAQEWK